MGRLVLIGGGELARVIIEAATAAGWSVLGFIDPAPCDETARRLGVPRLGSDEAISGLDPAAKFVLGVGSIKVSDVRRRIVERLPLGLDRWASIIHPAAFVSETSKVLPGAVVMPGAVVCTGAVIGEHAIVNLGAKIDHDVSIGAYVHVATNAAIGGGVTIEDDAYIGLGAVIRDHLTIRSKTLVGMGAVVANEYPAGSVLVGVPAKPLQREAKPQHARDSGMAHLER